MMDYSFSGSRHEDRPSRRRFAVVIYLPPPLEQIVAPLRERFDPDYDIVAAHITLVFPWQTTRSIAELSEILSGEIEKWESLTVELGSIGDFYPTAPIIYWGVKNKDVLARLYGLLYARLELPLPFKDFVPHVTVAKEISHHRVMMVKDEVASYLPDESFLPDAVDLISPVGDDRWVSVRTFTLRRG